jgi:hypothetical protein
MDERVKIGSNEDANRFLDGLKKDEHLILYPVFISEDRETFVFTKKSDSQEVGYIYLIQEACRRKIPIFIESNGETIPAGGKNFIFLSAADAQKVIQNPERLQKYQEKWIRTRLDGKGFHHPSLQQGKGGK